MSDSTWATSYEDPNNWLVIPDFGIRPRDVDFAGFEHPIFTPTMGRLDKEWALSLFMAVGRVREEARRRFRSLSALQEARGRFQAGILAPDERARAYVASLNDDRFAFEYDLFISFLRTATSAYSERSVWIAFNYLSHALGLAITLGKLSAGPETLQQLRSQIGRAGAAGRLESDPKQEAKRRVKECWGLWQLDPSRYTSKASFARDMLSKYEALDSQPVIEGWCRTWAKEAVDASRS